uniref:NAD(P)-binding protein n=1 Tax=Globisporangium ultimum (strain ATCC 200006 / CBS 805.95 / DAOM BR144) TaxID=431595 RepID=K3XD92_GLOUD
MPKKVIFVTGGNAGIGFQCCLALAKQPNTHVIVAGRNQQRVNDAVKEIKAAATPTSIIEPGIVDLASLKSVRTFANKLKSRQLQFSTIVCNGGVQLKQKEMTVDGFERTFGTNHLGHFLLLEILREQTQRIMMLGSETHDPAEKTGIAPPSELNFDQLARGYENFNAMEAYAASKLCNTLYAKEFVRRYPNGPTILVYSPGFTPDTSLFREQNRFVWLFMKPIFKFVSWLHGGRISTSEYSGGYMAKLASDEPLQAEYKSGSYIRVDEVWEVSKQAADPVLGKELWDKSEKWVQSA